MKLFAMSLLFSVKWVKVVCLTILKERLPIMNVHIGFCDSVLSTADSSRMPRAEGLTLK